MIFLKDIKNLMIYKIPFFLPTLEKEGNKKTKSAIFLLSPSKESSIKLMTHPLTRNMNRYMSYYIERDMTYYISNNVLQPEELVDEEYVDTRNNVVLEDTNINPLIKVSYEGYDSLVQKFSETFDNESYFDILHSLHYEVQEAPELHIICGAKDMDYTIAIEENLLTIVAPDISIYEEPEYYVHHIINMIYYSLMIYRFPQLTRTIIPNIIADGFTDKDSIYTDYFDTLFGDPETDTKGIITIDLFNEWCSTGNTEKVFKALADTCKFEALRLDDFRCIDNITQEAATKITVENLKRKFKYISTGKIKRKNSMKLNFVKRMTDKQSFIRQPFSAPSFGSSGGASSSNEASIHLLDNLYEEEYLNLDDQYVMFFNEDVTDNQLRKIIYPERIKRRKIVLDLDNEMKDKLPFIKYAFPELKTYKQKNIYVDLYYYTQVFFKNNMWKLKRGFELYYRFLQRLINDPRITDAGYIHKTIFIPVNDWDKNPNTAMWMFKNDINPISIIYQLMIKEPDRLKALFGNMDLVFFDKNRYFKMNFAELGGAKEIKLLSTKFRTFIGKIQKGDTFNEDEEANELDTKPTSDALKTIVYDKLDVNKGIDLTGKEKKLETDQDITRNKIKPKDIPASKIAVAPNAQLANKKSEVDKTVDKEEKALSKNADIEKLKKQEYELEKLAQAIDTQAKQSNSEDDLLNKLDHDEIKQMLTDLDSIGTNKVDVSVSRSTRIDKLSSDLLNKKIKDKTVQELISENPDKKPLPVTSLKIHTPNKEEWDNLTYINFDKTYNLDRDIVACFNHLSTCTRPIAIRNIKVEDNSTSEDRLELYTVEMEDFLGNRFTVKLDIPTIIDNRFLLRGNSKIIATQFLNMPILKTDLDTAQVITNYQKIFVRRYKTSTGRSTPLASRLIKALTKYQGRKLKIKLGDNSRVCRLYQLPIDYIDIASVIDTIEYPDNKLKIYFNQTNLRKDYPDIDDSKGIPYGIYTNTKEILYMDNSNITSFADELFTKLYSDEEFFDLVKKAKPTSSGTYSQCSILSAKIPLVLVTSYIAGLTKVLETANIEYRWMEKLDSETRSSFVYDYIQFDDGYLVYRSTYSSNLLLNGLKDCGVEGIKMEDMEKRSTYLAMLTDFGGRIKGDGIENFNDLLIDPITKEVLEHYNLPTDFISVLIYTNNLLADNKFIKHTDTSSRRIRRAELIASYTYEAISEAYGAYANDIRRGKKKVVMGLKQSTVIDKLLQSPITQDDSVNNALGAVEQTNTISFKGKAGLNNDRSYSLDKRTYDESMLNLIGMSTGFSGNVGITRQATVDMNIEGERGYIKQINSDVSQFSDAKTLAAVEAMTPFEVNHDDSTRVSMTFIQTSKHSVKVKNMDPLLVTSGIDEALPYLTTNKFSFKAKKDGKVIELTDEYMIVEYNDKTKEYINLTETIEKNSDGGYYVPLKLSAKVKLNSKFKENDILALDMDSFSNSLGEGDNPAYNVGTLAKVAIVNSDECFEDSAVCTHKIAEKMATKIIYKFEHTIEKNANIFEVAKIGQYMNVGDNLIVWQDPFEDTDANIVIKALSNSDTDISDIGRNTLSSDTTGILKAIKVYRTCDIDEEMSDSVKALVEAYEKPIAKLKKKLDKEGIYNTTVIPASYKLNPVGKLKKAVDAIYVEFYVEHDDIIGCGDKITYQSANKGVIKTVLPEGKEPFTDFRPDEEISAMLSITSINKRMVLSIVLDGALNKLMVELDRSVKDILDIPYNDGI